MDPVRKKRLAARRAWDTRRVYLFEKSLHGWESTSEMSMGALRRLAERVWAKESLTYLPCPAIVAGAGIRSGGVLVSYFHWYSWRIVLTRDARVPVVVLHELTHALGYLEHGPAFMKTYMRLLATYGRCDPTLLALNAGVMGVRVAK